MRLRTLLPVGFLALTALALAAQAMDLKWIPKVGDKATYKINGTFELAGIGEIVLGGSRTETVKTVEGDKIVTESISKMTANAMGNELPVPESKETTTSKPDGTILEVKEDDKPTPPTAMRLAHMTMFIYPSKPVAVNDTWTAEGVKDEKLDLPGYKIEYKLIGEEKVGDWNAWKVTAKGGETEGESPTKVESTFWVDKKDGTIVRSLSQLTDAAFPGPEGTPIPPLSGKMELVRQP